MRVEARDLLPGLSGYCAHHAIGTAVVNKAPALEFHASRGDYHFIQLAFELIGFTRAEEGSRGAVDGFSGGIGETKDLVTHLVSIRRRIAVQSEVDPPFMTGDFRELWRKIGDHGLKGGLHQILDV